MLELSQKLHEWAGKSRLKRALVGLPILVLVAVLFVVAFLRRPQPVGNPDLEAAEAEQKAEVERQLAEVKADEEAREAKAKADRDQALAEQKVEQARTEQDMRRVLDANLDALEKELDS